MFARKPLSLLSLEEISILMNINKLPLDIKVEILCRLIDKNKLGIVIYYTKDNILGFDDYGASATKRLLKNYEIAYTCAGFPRTLMTTVFINDTFTFCPSSSEDLVILQKIAQEVSKAQDKNQFTPVYKM